MVQCEFGILIKYYELLARFWSPIWEKSSILLRLRLSIIHFLFCHQFFFFFALKGKTIDLNWISWHVLSFYCLHFHLVNGKIILHKVPQPMQLPWDRSFGQIQRRVISCVRWLWLGLLWSPNLGLFAHRLIWQWSTRQLTCNMGNGICCKSRVLGVWASLDLLLEWYGQLGLRLSLLSPLVGHGPVTPPELPHLQLSDHC